MKPLSRRKSCLRTPDKHKFVCDSYFGILKEPNMPVLYSNTTANLNQQKCIDSKHNMTALKEFKKPREIYKIKLTPNTICSLSVYVS